MMGRVAVDLWVFVGDLIRGRGRVRVRVRVKV